MNLIQHLLSRRDIKFNDMSKALFVTRYLLMLALKVQNVSIALGENSDRGDAYYEIEFLKEFCVSNVAYLYLRNGKLFVSHQYEGAFDVNEEFVVDFDDQNSHTDHKLLEYANLAVDKDSIFSRMSDHDKLEFHKLTRLIERLKLLRKYANSKLESDLIGYAILDEYEQNNML